MESDARYAWVGLVVVTLIAAMALGFYWLNGSNKQEVNRFTIYFKNQSLEGLQINSDVRMQGIKVGKVADYTILPNEAKTVRVLLEVDARTPIRQGVEAVVSRNLVTGLAAVDLDNVGKDAMAIGAPPEGETYPVIVEGVPQIARISNTLEGLGKAGSEAVERINRLLSEQNQQAFSSLLNNMVGVSGELRQVGPELQATLGAARQASLRLDSVGAELGPVLQNSARVLSDSAQLVQQAGKRFDTMADSAESTIGAARNTMKIMDASLQDMQQQLRLSVDLGMQEIQATAQSLRSSSDTLLTTSQAYSDPGRLIYGPHPAEFGPGEQ